MIIKFLLCLSLQKSMKYFNPCMETRQTTPLLFCDEENDVVSPSPPLQIFLLSMEVLIKVELLSPLQPFRLSANISVSKSPLGYKRGSILSGCSSLVTRESCLWL